jgi:sec-independent protein translocase protein TatB
MFDIGFSELLVIGVVALLVIGPERLPKVARTAGLLFGRFQRYVNSVKADIGREMELDELRKAGQTFKESVEQAARGVESGVQEAEYSMRDEVVKPVEEAAKAVEETEPVSGQTESAAGEKNAEKSAAPEHKA